MLYIYIYIDRWMSIFHNINNNSKSLHQVKISILEDNRLLCKSKPRNDCKEILWSFNCTYRLRKWDENTMGEVDECWYALLLCVCVTKKTIT